MIKIQKNISLAPYTTFKIGGPARFFAEVFSEKELTEALGYAKKNNLNLFILGGGSNILISDEGFNGIVIRMLYTSCVIHNTSLECGAGLSLSKAVKLAADNSLSGLEWAAGIPGTIGGAMRGNAGAYGNCAADNIESVKALEMNRKANVKILSGKECHFSYRNSVFKENKKLIIISATLKLSKSDRKIIKAKMKDIVKKRSEKHPKEQSVGSFFQNPKVFNPKLIERFEEDSRVKCKDNKVPAGWLISEAGLKDRKIGGAKVSSKHANFIINTGKAKAKDVIMLASIIKQRVRTEFGVQLKEEIQYVGF